MLHRTNTKIADVPPCTDLTDLDIFHVALIVDLSDRSVSSPCCCFRFIFRDDWIKRVKRGRSAWCNRVFSVYINWGETRPAIAGVSCWNARERQHQYIAEFKSYLTLNHGFKEVATSFGIMKFSPAPAFSTKISIHRHMKEPQFPNGRIFYV